MFYRLISSVYIAKARPDSTQVNRNVPQLYHSAPQRSFCQFQPKLTGRGIFLNGILHKVFIYRYNALLPEQRGLSHGHRKYRK